MEVKKEIKRDGYAVKITLEEGGRVQGWVYVYIVFQDRHAEPSALLENVYVEPEWRNRGLGSKLVNLAVEEARARGCYKIIGTSKLDKVDLHKFYEKLGFSKMGYEFRIDLIPNSKLKTRD